jgi:hypothetical protein
MTSTPTEQLIIATRELAEFRERHPNAPTCLGHVKRLLGEDGPMLLSAYCTKLAQVQVLREVVEEGGE